MAVSKNDRGYKLSIFWVAFFGIGFWVVVGAYVVHKSNEKAAADEAAQPKWQTVEKIPVVARCREDHANLAGTYTGDVQWLVEAKSGQRRTFALLLGDLDEAQRNLELSLNELIKNPTGGQRYSPPPAVILEAEGHTLPATGSSDALGGDRPSYAVVCEVRRK